MERKNHPKFYTQKFDQLLTAIYALPKEISAHETPMLQQPPQPKRRSKSQR